MKGPGLTQQQYSNRMLEATCAPQWCPPWWHFTARLGALFKTLRTPPNWCSQTLGRNNCCSTMTDRMEYWWLTVAAAR